MTCALPPPPPRRQRWNVWTAWDSRLLVCLGVADVDRLGALLFFGRNLATGREPWNHERALLTRRARSRLRFGDHARADAGWSRGPEHLEFTEESGGTRLRARLGPSELDLLVARPPAHETLNFTAGFRGGRFQHNGKHFGLPVSGTLRHGAFAHRFEPGDAFATLDFGRGCWPDASRWYWANAIGRSGSRVVALNLGALWTDGSGTTENALLVDGRLHRLGQRVSFRPGGRLRDDRPARRDLDATWMIESVDDDTIRLHFTPISGRRTRGIAPTAFTPGMRSHQLYGRFDGVVRAGGERLRLEGATGWAEHCRFRW